MYRLTSRKFRYWVIGLILTVMLSGCQSLQPTQPGELTLQNSEFMSLWDTYNQCQADIDLVRMQQYVDQLNAAPKPISIHHSPIPLPRFLKNWASPRGSRLSVDPRAMTASCAIRAGKTASFLADHELAHSMFQLVISNYPEPEYSYYVEQAQVALNELSTVRPVSLSENHF